AARRLIGYAGDNPVFPRALTVHEVLTYYARLHCRMSNERNARGLVREALEITGLAAAAELRADSLGRADLHRLNFAQAALAGRRVLLLDETFSGLDAFARRDLRGRIARLAAEGVAVLITARDPAAGLEAPLAGRTVEAALALCRAHRLPVRASRVRVKSLEEIVLETHDAH